MKTGKDFEELVSLIEQQVHHRAIVTANDKLRDRDTGKLRQIDVSIRLADAHMEFLGIIEARDRGRPVGVEFVEQVAKKRESVHADAAFIVSKSGFYASALVKAKQCAIRTLTYEEAKESEWSKWLQTRFVSVTERRFDKIIVNFGHGDENEHSFNDTFGGGSFNNEIILSGNGDPLFTPKNLCEILINSHADTLFEDVEPDGVAVHKTVQFVGAFDPPIYLRSDRGVLVKITEIVIAADFYINGRQEALQLMRYRPSGSTESIAEVAVAEFDHDGRRIRLEIVAPGANDEIRGGAPVLIRHKVLDGI